MFKLNRTTEYALIALRYMKKQQKSADASLVSAREIADTYGLPFEITAKTLQKMKDLGLIESVHGARGGYALSSRVDSLSLGNFLSLMEGSQSLVACTADAHSPSHCEYSGPCEIKGVMGRLNSQVAGFLNSIPLLELAEDSKESFHGGSPILFQPKLRTSKRKKDGV